MAANMRPLTLGEILDRTVQLYRRNFVLLAGIAVPAAAFTVLITGSVVIFFSSQISALAVPPHPGQPAPPVPVFPPDKMIAFVVAFFLFCVIGVPLILGVFAMAMSALSYAASRLNRGESATIRSSYGYAFRHFWRHIGVLFFQSLFAGIIPFGILTALILVGAILSALVSKSGVGKTLVPLFVVLLVLLVLVWLVTAALIWLRLSLAYPSSVVEDRAAWDSVTRSNQLSNGARGRIFVMFLLVYVLTFVISMALTIPTDIVIALVMRKSFIGNQLPAAFLTMLQVANLASSFLVRVFVMPIYSTALLLFYFDQRTRIEGYDIEQLMEQAGWGDLPQNPPAQEHQSLPGPALVPALQSTEQGQLDTQALNRNPEGSDA